MSTDVKEVVNSLQQGFDGELIHPGDETYASARGVWNGMFDRRPGLIARCASVADVQKLVTTTAEANLLMAVRCGGHSLAGYSICDDGVLMDLSLLRNVDVDVDARIAKAGGGSLLGSIDEATQKHGLAYPAGVVSHTGASGLILGGGVGWLTRRFGLSCDNVRGFTMVATDGSVVYCNDNENADLFWALRGGGGNFGVVTEFELQLHPVSEVIIAGGYCLDDDIPRVLETWQDYMKDAPDCLKWSNALRLAPVRDNIPEHIRGKHVASLAIVWTGDIEEGHRYIDEVLSLTRPQGQMKEVMPFLKLQTFADSEFPHGRRYYSKSGYFGEFNASTIETLLSYLASIPSGSSQIELSYQGGAADRVGADETAYGARGWPLLFNLLGSWEDPADDGVVIDWVRCLFADLKPSMTPGFYVNFASSDDGDRVSEAYTGERLQRLQAVKTKYDPGNFFRLNQNIKPLQSTNGEN